MRKTLGIAVALAVLLGGQSAQTEILLDQETTGRITRVAGIGHGASGAPIWAQSFTVGIDGTLASVAPFIHRQSSIPSGRDLVAEIHSVANVLPSGALASVTVSEASVDTVFGFFNIDFSEAGISVRVGNVLAIVLIEPNDRLNTVYGWGGSNSDVYAGGAMSLDLGGGFGRQSGDFYFRTYVDSPTGVRPSTWQFIKELYR